MKAAVFYVQYNIYNQNFFSLLCLLKVLFQEALKRFGDLKCL